VDGVPATLGMTADPGRQTITVDGRPLTLEVKEYWLLNKPAGVVSSVGDTHGRRTVVECVPTSARVFPVGRLDLGTTGLLLLTNDGDLAERLTHPRYGIEKEYRVRVEGRVGAAELSRLRQGIELEEGVTAEAQVEILTGTEEETELRLVLHQGWNRQVRRMLEATGHPVVTLHRSRLDGISDRGLRVGETRRLKDSELARLRSAVSLETE
jgi:23S rRNA pseudouridine2605 synthase